MTYEIDVFPANNPLGAKLVTLGDNHLIEGTGFRPVKLGTGTISVALDADSVEADALKDDVFLQVRDTALGTTPIYGGFLDDARLKLVSETQDRRVLTWSGLGALSYLSRMTLLEQWYAKGPPVQTARGSRNIDGMWTWIREPWGAIARRGAEEGRDHPDAPLGAITITFNRDADSNGNPWTITDEVFQTAVGTNVLDLYVTLIRAGFIPVMSPGLVLSGYETYGSDHSGAAFGANVVRFQVGANPTDLLANIMTDAERSWVSSRLSSLLVIGADNVTAVVTDAAAPVKKVGAFHYPESADPARLSSAGQAELARRALRTIGSLRLPVILGDDPLAGQYRPAPGRPLWVGNTVSAYTGPDVDYDINANMPVAALDFRLSNAKGWECWAELGTAFVDRAQRAQDGTVRQIVKGTTPRPHSHPEMLCRPAVQGGTPTFVKRESKFVTATTDIPLSVGAEANKALYLAVVVRMSAVGTTSAAWHPAYVNAGSPGAGEAMTKVASLAHPSVASFMVEIWRRTNPSPSTQTTSAVRWFTTGTVEGGVGGCWLLSGVNQTTPENATGTNSGGGGSGSTVTVTSPADDLVLDTAGWLMSNAILTAPAVSGGQTQDWALVQDNSAGVGDVGAGGAHGASGTPSWNFTNVYDNWLAAAVSVAGTGGANPQDGHADLVGKGPGVAGCSHRHDVHRDRAPTVNDDWATKGYKLGTIWAQLDSLTTPTAIVGTWMLVATTTGAAKWLSMGAAHPNLAAHDSLGLATQAELDAHAATAHGSTFRWAPMTFDPLGDGDFQPMYTDDGSMMMMEVYD